MCRAFTGGAGGARDAVGLRQVRARRSGPFLLHRIQERCPGFRQGWPRRTSLASDRNIGGASPAARSRGGEEMMMMLPVRCAPLLGGLLLSLAAAGVGHAAGPEALVADIEARD